VATIEALIAEEMAAQNLPGAAVAVTIPGRGEYFGAKGIANLETGAARAPEDPFRIASITKTIIGTLVLQLVDEGKLALSDPLATWMPDFPNAEKITVADLLGMRSGIVDPWTPEMLEEWYADPTGPLSAEEMIARAAANGAAFGAPGGKPVYVNLNFNLLDRIIEEVSGMPVPEAAEARIFGPLGMANSEIPTDTALPGQLRGYGWDAARDAFDDKTVLDPSVPGGAGAAVSTLADLTVYLRAICTGALLSPETQAARMTTEPLVGAASYGLGIATLGPFCGHNGTIMGFSSEAWYLPAEDATIVVNVNRLDVDDESKSGDLFAKIARALFPEALK
jgi:D-alanyl-D-alanine carboxypeptidase